MVGNDVWIGRNSVILPGVHIGDGAVIAAQSVVSRDVPPYTVYGGNPSRFLKERFSPELKALLLRLKWWDLPGDTLVEILPLLCSPDLEAAQQALVAYLPADLS